jgi:hypothetical protein
MRLIQGVSLADWKFDGSKIQGWGKPGRWLLVGGGLAAMLYWNEQLTLATSTGVAVMLLVYLLHRWKLEIPWSDIRKVLQPWNHPVVLSVAAGSAATLISYMAASVWLESDSHWVAAAAILQGTGTLALLILLIWQSVTRQTERDRRWLQRALDDLSDADPLRRLVAVRYLSSRIPDWQDNQTQQQELADYFCLMLRQEQEERVRDAILDGLERLERVKLLRPSHSR